MELLTGPGQQGPDLVGTRVRECARHGADLSHRPLSGGGGAGVPVSPAKRESNRRGQSLFGKGHHEAGAKRSQRHAGNPRLRCAGFHHRIHHSRGHWGLRDPLSHNSRPQRSVGDSGCVEPGSQVVSRLFQNGPKVRVARDRLDGIYPKVPKTKAHQPRRRMTCNSMPNNFLITLQELALLEARWCT